MQNMARRLTKSVNAIQENSGAFMGFDTLLEDSDNSDVEKGDSGDLLDEVLNLSSRLTAIKYQLMFKQEPLIANGLGSNIRSLSTEFALNGLSNWLDRLFEGTTQRYYINYWPDFGNF